MQNYNNIKIEDYRVHEAEQMKLYDEYSHKLNDLRVELSDKTQKLCSLFNNEMNIIKTSVCDNTEYTQIGDDSISNRTKEVIDKFIIEKRELANEYSVKMKEYLEKILELDIIEVNGKRYVKSYYLNYNKLYNIDTDDSNQRIVGYNLSPENYSIEDRSKAHYDRLNSIK